MARRPALLAAVLVTMLTACGAGNGDSSPAAVRASAGSAAVEETTTTSTTAAAAPTTSTTLRGATTTPTRPTASTSRTGGPTSTVMAGPRPLTPPVPGTYRYTTSGQTVVAGSRVVFPAVTTLVADPPSGTRQHSTRNLRDDSGNGTATEFTLDYRAGGVYLVGLRITTGFSGMTDARDLTPSSPVLLLPTGARPGAHVESDLAAGGGAARLVVDVLRDERLTIGGQVVDTLVMRAAVTLPPGDVTGRQELTVNVDPGSRLWVRERGVADASAAGGLITLHSDYTATLQRLIP